jgi:hypothetical protein
MYSLGAFIHFFFYFDFYFLSSASILASSSCYLLKAISFLNL